MILLNKKPTGNDLSEYRSMNHCGFIKIKYNFIEVFLPDERFYMKGSGNAIYYRIETSVDKFISICDISNHSVILKLLVMCDRDWFTGVPEKPSLYNRILRKIYHGIKSLYCS